jgi:putative inorganic carbon (HCO3(-)) transporter
MAELRLVAPPTDTLPADVESRGAHDPLALVTRWVVRVLAFLLPLAFLPNLVEEFVLPKLLLARLGILILALLLLARWLKEGQVTWRRTAVDLPMVAFLVSAGISTVFAVNRNVALFGTYDRWEGFLTIATYGLLLWLTVQTVQRSEEARAITWALLLSAFVVSVVAVLQSMFGYLGGGYFHTGSFIRADATLANPDFLGVFLALLLPIALSKIISRRPPLTRLLALDVFVLMFMGLVASFTRSGWIGAFAGCIAVLALRRGRLRWGPLVVAGAVVVLFVGIGLAGFNSQPTTDESGARAVISRVASIADFSSGTIAQRISVWRETLPLIASRPLFGYGPDTFGLVYPNFQTVSRGGTQWDKTHNDTLQVGATQGLLGVAAYIWLLVAFALAFWKGRRYHGAVALFGGWLAYVVAEQFQFSFIPTAMPFWVLSAAALLTWAPNSEVIYLRSLPRVAGMAGLAVAIVFGIVLFIPLISRPFLADAAYYRALAAEGSGDNATAKTEIANARQLSPESAEYAASAGDLALDLDVNDKPGPDADWAAAREAYSDAARLGSYLPDTFRHLAIVDEHLGDHDAALAAARRAVALDRFSAQNRQLLSQLGG